MRLRLGSLSIQDVGHLHDQKVLRHHRYSKKCTGRVVAQVQVLVANIAVAFAASLALIHARAK